MAPWQPPIPAGALYSPPARTLGAGLALLAYCYDCVERNGWLSLDLRAASEELNAPYSTLKDWWRLLKDGPFFSERRDRGKAGWRVRFADDWLDWRSTALDPSRRDEGGSTVLEATSTAPSRLGEGASTVLDDNEGAVKAASRLGEGASTVLEFLHVGTHGSRSSTSSDDDDDMRQETSGNADSRQSSSSSNPPAARVEPEDEAPEQPPQGTHMELILWNERASDTVIIQTGDASVIRREESGSGFVGTATKKTDESTALLKTITGYMKPLEAKLRNAILKNLQLDTLTCVNLLQSVADANLINLTTSEESSFAGFECSISLRANQKEIWGGFARYVAPSTSTNPFLTLTISRLDLKVAQIFLTTFKSSAPTATSAKPSGLQSGSELPPAIERAFADWQGRPAESGDRKVLLSLLGDYGASWLESGIDAAVAQGGRNLNYLRAMFERCRANGTAPGDPKTTPTGATNGTHNPPGSRSRGPTRRPVSPPLDDATVARYRAAPKIGDVRPDLCGLPGRDDRSRAGD